MSETGIIIAIVGGLWLISLSVAVRDMALNKVDWEDHERLAATVRQMKHDAVMMPLWMKRVRFWRLVWADWKRHHMGESE